MIRELKGLSLFVHNLRYWRLYVKHLFGIHTYVPGAGVTFRAGEVTTWTGRHCWICWEVPSSAPSPDQEGQVT